MTKTITVLAATLAAAAAALALTTALTEAATLRSQYEHDYHAVAKRFGVRAPGRNIARYGMRGGHPATRRALRRSLGVLHRMLHPAPVYVAPSMAASAPAGSSVSASSSGASGVPACASESGTNYSTGAANTNPSSGATGRYQIIPSTHAAVCSDLGWSPPEQDECAGRIHAVQGSGAWVGCG